ncbi:MAG TPA: creatininase family protein, partial [Thermomicrobiales bacterium]|nr:creatininase family protein [Thermomicrobiales bacterium]
MDDAAIDHKESNDDRCDAAAERWPAAAGRSFVARNPRPLARDRPGAAAGRRARATRPNIAVSTDTVAADALCQAAAAIVGPRIAVAPAIPWGISWHHMRFPGTITLRPETLTALLADIVGSLHAHGVRRVLVVNGHGGNTATITTAIEQIKQETEMPFLAAIFGYALIAEQA